MRTAEIFLIARVVACAHLLAFGVLKVAGPGEGCAWLSAPFSVIWLRLAIVAVSVVEIVLAFVLVLGLLDGQAAVLTCFALMVPLTYYSVTSIRKTGSCGCAGSRAAVPAPRTPGGLVARNFCLFAALSSGAVFGPRYAELGHGALAITGLAPLLYLTGRVFLLRIRALLSESRRLLNSGDPLGGQGRSEVIACGK